MTVPSIEPLPNARPASLTPAHAEACLPGYEINPDWQARRDRGEIPDGIRGMGGMLRLVWPEERFTEEEARWILTLRETTSWRVLANEVLGNSNQIFGMGLEQAALRALGREMETP
ncbi:MAG: hypothetical protein Q8M09_20725 [Pseudomonadota bacterium]|nr:hypothetical protein [Pseudomonadota bacterium]MDP1906630.1 hypothetical protein [Pseudomonadota bacterium]MDP2354049.1 hypothetical protein [Pseudomonadota bacterium]